ncbi:MAG: hypothetical protein ACI4GC_03840, partial [Acutalibacteraceae bacterium]
FFYAFIISYLSTFLVYIQKNKENKNIIRVLKYIAEKEKFISGGEIEYRKLYYFFLRKRFLETAKKNKVKNFTVSIRQYKRLRVYRSGQFPINAAVYLLTLYEIMYDYKKKADIGKEEKDISYTTYMVNELKVEIQNIIMQMVNGNLLATFKQIQNNFVDLDNKTGSKPVKIYNNIW